MSLTNKQITDGLRLIRHALEHRTLEGLNLSHCVYVLYAAIHKVGEMPDEISVEENP